MTTTSLWRLQHHADGHRRRRRSHCDPAAVSGPRSATDSTQHYRSVIIANAHRPTRFNSIVELSRVGRRELAKIRRLSQLLISFYH